MATANNLKMINMEKVKRCLKSGKPYTKISLASASGLSVATCGNILKELLGSGEVTETVKADSTGGRPSRQFVYNEDFSYVLALYVRKERSVESIYCNISNLFGKQVYENHTIHKLLTIDDINNAVSSTMDKYSNIKALSIGVPGVVNEGKTGFCDFISLNYLDIKTYFEDRYDIKTAVLNDVNSCALGYYSRYKPSENQNIAYIYYPDGGDPGAGIIINGNVVIGSSNFAGEVAYLSHRTMCANPQRPADQANFIEDVLRTILAVNCVINPQTIVLSGYQFNDSNISEIRKLSQSYIPKGHVPNIVVEPDIHDSYINGLTSLALDQLTYNYKLVEK